MRQDSLRQKCCDEQPCPKHYPPRSGGRGGGYLSFVEQLNAKIRASDKQVRYTDPSFTGGEGIIVRALYDYLIFGEHDPVPTSHFNIKDRTGQVQRSPLTRQVCPSTFWHNDCIVPGQVYPASESDAFGIQAGTLPTLAAIIPITPLTNVGTDKCLLNNEGVNAYLDYKSSILPKLSDKEQQLLSHPFGWRTNGKPFPFLVAMSHDSNSETRLGARIDQGDDAQYVSFVGHNGAPADNKRDGFKYWGLERAYTTDELLKGEPFDHPIELDAYVGVANSNQCAGVGNPMPLYERGVLKSIADGLGAGVGLHGQNHAGVSHINVDGHKWNAFTTARELDLKIYAKGALGVQTVWGNEDRKNPAAPVDGFFRKEMAPMFKLWIDTLEPQPGPFTENFANAYATNLIGPCVRDAQDLMLLQNAYYTERNEYMDMTAKGNFGWYAANGEKDVYLPPPPLSKGGVSDEANAVKRSVQAYWGWNEINVSVLNQSCDADGKYLGPDALSAAAFGLVLPTNWKGTFEEFKEVKYVQDSLNNQLQLHEDENLIPSRIHVVIVRQVRSGGTNETPHYERKFEELPDNTVIGYSQVYKYVAEDGYLVRQLRWRVEYVSIGHRWSVCDSLSQFDKEAIVAVCWDPDQKSLGTLLFAPGKYGIPDLTPKALQNNTISPIITRGMAVMVPMWFAEGKTGCRERNNSSGAGLNMLKVADSLRSSDGKLHKFAVRHNISLQFGMFGVSAGSKTAMQTFGDMPGCVGCAFSHNGLLKLPVDFPDRAGTSLYLAGCRDKKTKAHYVPLWYQFKRQFARGTVDRQYLQLNNDLHLEIYFPGNAGARTIALYFKYVLKSSREGSERAKVEEREFEHQLFSRNNYLALCGVKDELIRYKNGKKKEISYFDLKKSILSYRPKKEGESGSDAGSDAGSAGSTTTPPGQGIVVEPSALPDEGDEFDSDMSDDSDDEELPTIEQILEGAYH